MNTVPSFRQAIHALNCINDRDLDHEQMQTLCKIYLPDLLLALKKEILPNRMIFRNMLGLSPVLPEHLVLPVDYDKTFPQLLDESEFVEDWSVQRGNIVIVGKGVQYFEFKYYYLDSRAEEDQVFMKIRDIDPENPWQPAKMEHGLTFARFYPDEQLDQDIVIIGSALDVEAGHRHIGFLDILSGSNRLLLKVRWCDGHGFRFRTGTRFLIVRKFNKD